MIEYDSDVDSDSDDDDDNVQLERKPNQQTSNEHCSKWMQGHQKSECEIANHLMSDESSDEELEDTAGFDPEGVTAESETEPEPEEAYHTLT